MRKCDLETGATRVRKSLDDLLHAWDQAHDQWHDRVSDQFFQQHIEPLVPEVRLALDAIARMHLLLNEVQRDCEQ